MSTNYSYISSFYLQQFLFFYLFHLFAFSFRFFITVQKCVFYIPPIIFHTINLFCAALVRCQFFHNYFSFLDSGILYNYILPYFSLSSSHLCIFKNNFNRSLMKKNILNRENIHMFKN